MKTQYIKINTIGDKFYYSDKKLTKLHREDGPAIEYANGNKYWCVDGKFHRENGPAIEYANGNKWWYVDGKIHRENGPAFEYANGGKSWYLNSIEYTEQEHAKRTKKVPTININGKEFTLDIYNINMKTQYIKINTIGDKFYYSDKKLTKLHRENGPAIEYAVSGTKEWYFEGKLHRENGPAMERTNGDKYWSLHGNPHRVDGPACEWANGDKAWYLNGLCHRVDGPAIENANGNKKWCLHGSFVSQEEHAKRTKKVPTININGKEFTLDELNSLIKIAKGN